MEWIPIKKRSANSEFILHILQKTLHDEFRPVPNSAFNIHNPVGIKFLTRLKLGLSHVNEHRFNHKFKNCTNLKCIFSSENELTFYFSLFCHFYIPIRATLFDKLKEIVNNLQKLHDQTVTEILWYGSPNFKGN